MLVTYIAHQLNAPTRAGIDRNRELASLWVAWLAREFLIAPIADWIILTGHWTEELRDRGLAIDLALVERADEVWLVGPRVSAGMVIESEHARKLGKPVRDITGVGHPWGRNTDPEQKRFITWLLAGRTDAEAARLAKQTELVPELGR